MGLSSQEQYARNILLDRSAVPSFEEYPFSIPAVRHLTRLEFHPKVTFLIGENGTGKSTLLEAIAVKAGFNPEGGSRNFNFATRESHSQLHDHMRLGQGIRQRKDGFFLRAESFYNVATEIERIDKDPDSGGGLLANSYGGASLHEQSHGESFLTLLTQRFAGNGLYILDEPEAALSPTRQMSVLTVIHDLVKRSSQFIIATHSPIIMAYPDSVIYHLSEDGIRRIDYTDTEHYRVTRDFLDRREMMLKVLLKDSAD